MKLLPVVPVLLVSFLLFFTAGCVSSTIGDVEYNPGNVTVAVDHSGAPVEAGVQARIFSLSEFEQHELLTTGTGVTLATGKNSIALPVSLSPGRYKIYVYLTTDGRRETAVIRDISV